MLIKVFKTLRFVSEVGVHVTLAFALHCNGYNLEHNPEKPIFLPMLSSTNLLIASVASFRWIPEMRWHF